VCCNAVVTVIIGIAQQISYSLSDPRLKLASKNGMDLRGLMIDNKCEWTLDNGEYNFFHAYHEPSNGEQHHGAPSTGANDQRAGSSMREGKPHILQT